MLPLYNLGLRFYFFFIYIASFFNKKARLWIKGRQRIQYQQFDKSAWFHFASLGEYEQGLPVLLAFRQLHADIPVVVTFFSPSGYEVRKNTPYADAVYYLPLDTAGHARNFIDAINPSIAVFTKYEYWFHYFHELNRRNVPLFVISGIFRPDQVFFKWYGSLHRRMLGYVKRFFVQDEESKRLLEQLNITNVSVSGDTRFDRVWANAQNPKSFEIVEDFTRDHKVLVAGSTWPQDEDLLAELIKSQGNWKFIIAPHEIREEKIERLLGMLPQNLTTRYSQLDPESYHGHVLLQTQVLVIDNIGMLSSLYRYGDIAYIGGGFGAGIHNTLEAAAFGLPVIFGPNYQKFKEARELVVMQLGFSVNNAEELLRVFAGITANENKLHALHKDIERYVVENKGATNMIIGVIGKY
ncbi:MAG TPA: glycosyltransferase N-terminal domain-containing protein [Mucilaginibacter sp.]|jgi:3-deoxy-D-manno-octulosonic-acid transferase|nr:glycosyltransferase N-terminal domain-containing protein [Mucilaginibacter sp.]